MTLIRFKPELAEQSPALGPTDLLRDFMNLQFPFFPGERAGTKNWTPALDIFEDQDVFTVALEAPGLSKEDFEISYHEGTLSIAGERRAEAEKAEQTCFRRERLYGKFSRSVALPADVKAEGISASYKDGILLVTLPKAEEAKPRQIEVSVN